jgi:hypothetical protein
VKTASNLFIGVILPVLAKSPHRGSYELAGRSPAGAMPGREKSRNRPIPYPVVANGRFAGEVLCPLTDGWHDY